MPLRPQGRSTASANAAAQAGLSYNNFGRLLVDDLVRTCASYLRPTYSLTHLLTCASPTSL